MYTNTDNPEPGLSGPVQRRMPPDKRTPTSADRPGRDKLTLSMEISDVYLGMGQDAFDQLVRSVSIGKLKTYQMYEGFKVRAHLQKVNTELLRKSVPRFWARIAARDEDFGKDLAQAILVSHLEMIVAILDFLGVPHENGFFAKGYGPETVSYRRLGRPGVPEFPGTFSGSACRFLCESFEVGIAGSYRSIPPGNP